MINDFVSSLCFSNFILSLRMKFTVGISIGSDSFIKFLLLFQLILCLNIFLLILRNQISLKFDFLQRLQIFSIRKCCFFAICIFFFLDILNLFFNRFNSFITFINFLFIIDDILLFFIYLLVIGFKLALHLDQLILDLVSFIFELDDFFLVLMAQLFAIHDLSMDLGDTVHKDLIIFFDS